MTLIAERDAPPPGEPSPGVAGVSPQEAAWRHAEGEARAVMGTVNSRVARLVAAIGNLLLTDGWQGVGIRSPEHWVCWKAGLSYGRAVGLVRIARRAGELPACFALFAQGRLGEDAMVRIARRVPATRDAEIAALAPSLLIAQLERVLRALPEQPDGTDRRAEPERMCRLSEGRDGWTRGEFCLPPDEGAIVRQGLLAGRDAELADHGPTDHENLAAGGGGRRVTWADGLVRMASEATDALDPTLARTGTRSERNLVVLHHDVDPDGTLGPGQIQHGPVIPDPIARYMACDAHVQVMTYQHGQLAGINPTRRLANQATRRYLARRDQGCTHPLCNQRLWLHTHHIVHWQNGGPTTPSNLVSLCGRHHRALHLGEFTLDGDPETGTLRFHDPWGQPIAPPDPQPPDREPQPGPPPPYIPPLGEPLRSDTFTWN